MFSKPAVLGALARFVLSAYVAMVCRRFFSVSVGALFFVELKFGREISHDLKGLCHGSPVHFVYFCQLLALSCYGTLSKQRNYL